jgi:hypothetical protein
LSPISINVGCSATDDHLDLSSIPFSVIIRTIEVPAAIRSHVLQPARVRKGRFASRVFNPNSLFLCL